MAERFTPSLQDEAPAVVPPRRWLWPLVLVLVALAAALLLMVGGAFDGVRSLPSKPAVAARGGAASPAVPVAGTLAPVAQAGAVPAHAPAAVILPSDPSSPAQPAVAASAPLAAAKGNAEAASLSDMLLPAKDRKAVPVSPPRPVRSSADNGGDADVALLSALIKHVEVESAATRKARDKAAREAAPAAVQSIDVRMQACPAANTEAGLHCREQICRGHVGSDAACPAAVAGGA